MKETKEKKKGKRRWLGLSAALWLTVILCACGRSGGAEGLEAETEAFREEGLEVYFFGCSDDADSILLHSGTEDVMIDTGLEEDSEAMLARMKSLGVEQLDLLILTHPDKDHIGGAASVLQEFDVEEVVQTNCVKGSELQARLEELLRQENVTIPAGKEEREYGGLQLVIYPPEKARYDNSNNYSIAVLAEYEGVRFFFAGDAKKKRLEELLKEDWPRVDVYKAAHHGRDNKNSDDMVRALMPEAVVVTAREPEQDTAKAIRECGAALYSTFSQTLCFRVENGVLRVETEAGQPDTGRAPAA